MDAVRACYDGRVFVLREQLEGVDVYTIQGVF